MQQQKGASFLQYDDNSSDKVTTTSRDKSKSLPLLPPTFPVTTTTSTSTTTTFQEGETNYYDLNLNHDKFPQPPPRQSRKKRKKPTTTNINEAGNISHNNGNYYGSIRNNPPLMRDINKEPPITRRGATTNRDQQQQQESRQIQTSTSTSTSSWWSILAKIMTLPFYPYILYLKSSNTPVVVIQAWREKVALCILILLISFIIAFLTFGLKPILCSTENKLSTYPLYDQQTTNNNNQQKAIYYDHVAIRGVLYDYSSVKNVLIDYGVDLTSDWDGSDISLLFNSKLADNHSSSSSNNNDKCKPYYTSSTTTTTINTVVTCTIPNKIQGSPPLQPQPGFDCPSFDIITSNIPVKGLLYLGWQDLKEKGTQSSLFVYGSVVIDASYILNDNNNNNTQLLLNFSKEFIKLVREESLGKDSSLILSRKSETIQSTQCIQQKYTVGLIGGQTVGCVANNIVIVFCLSIVLGVLLVRFTMAVAFNWLISNRLVKKQYKRNNSTNDPYIIMLVTCYSEGKQGIKSTLDSLSTTTYPNEKKLLFVICDGIITGKGNQTSTPEIVKSMMSQIKTVQHEKSYLAIGHGDKQHNTATIYSGYYNDCTTTTATTTRKVPMILVIKTGTPNENRNPTTTKPGNRGKRDSQLVLMNFLSRVLFDDRMSQVDYELFNAIKCISNVTPDKYDLLLMVDADTVVACDSLLYMTRVMKNDPSIMGLCGETRIANKRTNWVTYIQVFEYYVSHHLGKAFESMFGGVTCLPGCFCMYRIKGKKGPNGHFVVPILCNPDVVEEYSENIVDTLHKKNLLLLGEDRFLSTLMLRTFPKRKMMFVPQAICHTTVPDEFKILLSQRRRWINSTIHNLLELVRLRDLCGIFCCSMQFVVALELVGTVILPCAIVFALFLLLGAVITGSSATLPLILLAITMGLPGMLIVVTTREFIYVGYMFIYILALPLWNLVLPLYAFWHFDDFSWGETRKVEGEAKTGGHDGEGSFDINSVQLKKWIDWELERNQVPASRSETVQAYLYSVAKKQGYTNEQIQQLKNPENRESVRKLIGTDLTCRMEDASVLLVPESIATSASDIGRVDWNGNNHHEALSLKSGNYGENTSKNTNIHESYYYYQPPTGGPSMVDRRQERLREKPSATTLSTQYVSFANTTVSKDTTRSVGKPKPTLKNETNPQPIMSNQLESMNINQKTENNVTSNKDRISTDTIRPIQRDSLDMAPTSPPSTLPLSPTTATSFGDSGIIQQQPQIIYYPVQQMPHLHPTTSSTPVPLMYVNPSYVYEQYQPSLVRSGIEGEVSGEQQLAYSIYNPHVPFMNYPLQPPIINNTDPTTTTKDENIGPVVKNTEPTTTTKDENIEPPPPPVVVVGVDDKDMNMSSIDKTSDDRPKEPPLEKQRIKQQPTKSNQTTSFGSLRKIPSCSTLGRKLGAPLPRRTRIDASTFSTSGNSNFNTTTTTTKSNVFLSNNNDEWNNNSYTNMGSQSESGNITDFSFEQRHSKPNKVNHNNDGGGGDSSLMVAVLDVFEKTSMTSDEKSRDGGGGDGNNNGGNNNRFDVSGGGGDMRIDQSWKVKKKSSWRESLSGIWREKAKPKKNTGMSSSTATIDNVNSGNQNGGGDRNRNSSSSSVSRNTGGGTSRNSSGARRRLPERPCSQSVSLDKLDITMIEAIPITTTPQQEASSITKSGEKNVKSKDQFDGGLPKELLSESIMYQLKGEERQPAVLGETNRPSLAAVGKSSNAPKGGGRRRYTVDIDRLLESPVDSIVNPYLVRPNSKNNNNNKKKKRHSISGGDTASSLAERSFGRYDDSIDGISSIKENSSFLGVNYDNEGGKIEYSKQQEFFGPRSPPFTKK